MFGNYLVDKAGCLNSTNFLKKPVVSLDHFFFSKYFGNFCEKVMYTRQLMTTDSISFTKGKRIKTIYS